MILQNHSNIDKVLKFLKGLYTLQETSSLVRWIIDGLPELIGGDNFMVGQHNWRTRTPLNLSLKHPAARADVLDAACESGAIREHPIWAPNPDPSRVTKMLSEMMTLAEWESHPMYCEVLREDRVMDHLTIDFRRDRNVDYMIGVTRSSRGFSDRDQETLTILRPHFEQAFSNARTLQTSVLANGSDLRHPTVTHPIDHHGTLMHSRREVHARWTRRFGVNTASVIDELERWIRHHLDLLNRGVIDTAVVPFLVKQETCVTEFRLHRQWGGRGYVISERTLAKGTQDSHGLSPREREVLHWVREGKENSEIAVILGMSKHTVKDHLKHIYRKLGVDNRTAAARIAEGNA